jgi:hypothetical protein
MLHHREDRGYYQQLIRKDQKKADGMSPSALSLEEI